MEGRKGKLLPISPFSLPHAITLFQPSSSGQNHRMEDKNVFPIFTTPGRTIFIAIDRAIQTIGKEEVAKIILFVLISLSLKKSSRSIVFHF